MSARLYRRCWVYENACGDLSITCLPSVAKDWRRMFRERGERGVVVEMRLTATCKDGLELVRSRLGRHAAAEGGARG